MNDTTVFTNSSNWVGLLLGIAGVLILSGFMPFSAYSFFKHRLPKKSKQFDRMLSRLGYKGGHSPAYVPKLDEEFNTKDYYAPVTFATIITLIGAVVLVFGGRLLCISHMVIQPDGEVANNVSLLLDGPRLASIDNQYPAVLGMLVIGVAFAGSYIWCVQNLFRRLSTLDLSPGAYYSVGLRMIFSIFVAIMLYYAFFPETGNSNFTSKEAASLAIIAFVVGIFPQRGLQMMKEKADNFISPSRNKTDTLPLDMIEGIQSFEKLRLSEVGIDNAQNLGKAHFLELIIRTPFNPREVIDWIGQARLYLFFKDDIEKMRDAGVRTIFDFRKVSKTDDGIKRMAQQSGIQIERIKTVADVIKDDADVNHLETAIAKLVGYFDSDQKKV